MAAGSKTTENVSATLKKPSDAGAPPPKPAPPILAYPWVHPLLYIAFDTRNTLYARKAVTHLSCHAVYPAAGVLTVNHI